LLRPLADIPSEAAIIAKADEEGSVVLGWARLLVNLSRFWAGYLLRIRPLLRQNGLVVADRWAYGYLAQPRALRFYGPAWLARGLLRIFPRPSLAVIAKAPPEIIVSRKQELTWEQVSQELAAWDEVISFGPVLRVDTTEPPEKLAMDVKRFVLGR
jgi:thymidylate kinase